MKTHSEIALESITQAIDTLSKNLEKGYENHYRAKLNKIIQTLEGMRLPDNGCAEGCGLDEEDVGYNMAISHAIKKIESL